MYCRLSLTMELCHVLHSAPPTATQSFGVLCSLSLSFYVRVLILTCHQHRSSLFLLPAASTNRQHGDRRDESLVLLVDVP